MVKVFHMELQQNLWNGLWDKQITALCAFGFIMKQCS
jgi:hypothetical protein